MRTILIILALFTATSANAFYTTFEYDIEHLRKGLEEEGKGTKFQRDAFITQITETIRQAREDAYERIVTGCRTDVARLCQGLKINNDSSVRCLSDNKEKLSASCNYVIQQNFRQD